MKDLKDFFLKALPFLAKKETTAIGLDWSRTQFRLIEVRKELGRPKITRFFLGEIQGTPETAIQQAVQSSGITSSLVRVAISGEGVVVRYLILPLMKKQEVPTAVSFELEKYIPYKESEVFFDYQLLGETKEKKMHVLIVAVRRQIVQTLIEFLQKLSLQPTLIDVAGFAVCNALLFNQIQKDSQEAIAVVHVAEELTTVNVLKGGTGYFSRDISMGKAQVASDAALLVDLANEVRYSLDYYESQWSDPVKKIYLSGQLKEESHLASLQKMLGLETTFWDPTGGFQISQDIPSEAVKKMKQDFHLTLGLAIRDL